MTIMNSTEFFIDGKVRLRNDGDTEKNDWMYRRPFDSHHLRHSRKEYIH